MPQEYYSVYIQVYASGEDHNSLHRREIVKAKSMAQAIRKVGMKVVREVELKEKEKV